FDGFRATTVAAYCGDVANDVADRYASWLARWPNWPTATLRSALPVLIPGTKLTAEILCRACEERGLPKPDIAPKAEDHVNSIDAATLSRKPFALETGWARLPTETASERTETVKDALMPPKPVKP